MSNTNTNGKWFETEVAQGVLQKKYLHENETFEQMVARVSEVSGLPEEYLVNADFFPGGRSIVGAGLKGKQRVSTSNCYVLSSPLDTLDSIFDTCKEAAIIGSLGGGVGVALDNIRPKGSIINNSAKESSGVEFVMNLLNETGQNIGQSGRHMAIMVMLDCNHPDITEFLGIKQRNNKLDSMNISIKFTDKFMKAVEDNQEYKLSFTVDSTGETIEKTINAREFFQKFCECQYDWGDPGACFIDRVRSYNLLSGYEDYKIDASNPCFTGDMRLLTDKGYRSFDELNGQAVNVVSYDGTISSGKVWYTGKKETVTVKLRTKEMTCTPNHLFMTVDKKEVMARDLKGKSIMPYVNSSNRSNDLLYEKLGFIQGDGQLTRLNSAAHLGLEVNIGEKDGDILDLFGCTQADLCSNGRSLYVTGYSDMLRALKFSAEPLPNRVFPETYGEWDIEQQSAFLRGCYSANGCVMNGKSGFRVQYKTTCQQFATKMIDALADMGIESYVTVNKPKNIEFSNGVYECKESYDINIADYESKQMFYNKIGFIQRYKDTLLLDLLIANAPVVTSVTNNGVRKVYDFSEPNNHWGVVEGKIAHNCAEFFGSAGNACNLGSINLYNVVDQPFTKDAKVDIGKLRKLAADGVDALNKILDYGYSMQPLDSNRKCIDDWRSIGLGVFGVADMLIALGLRYGSEEANSILENIMYNIFAAALNESCNLAAIYAPFGKYDWENISKSPIIERLRDTLVYGRIKTHGLRNGNLMSIAPAGTISTMCGISNGCEPLFAISYERTTHSLEKQGKYFKVYAKSVGDLLKYHGINPDEITIDEIKKRFPFVVESNDIPPEERVKTQAALQQYCDNAISSTVNLKESATPQDIFNTYMLAWKLGCKGLTVFRTGCKRGSILGKDKSTADTTDKPEITFDHIHPAKRSNIRKLSGSTVVKSTACVPKMYVTINTKDNEIFEVFTAAASGCKSNIGNITRLASLALRSGVAVKEVIGELRENQCPACTVLKQQGKDVCLSCGNAIADAIEEAYVGLKKPQTSQEDTELAICPECGEHGLIPTGKCVTCRKCGWSKCD